MSDPKAPEPQTPKRDQHDNEAFDAGGGGSAEGSGYPEESPQEAQPDGADPNPSRRTGDRDGA